MMLVLIPPAMVPRGIAIPFPAVHPTAQADPAVSGHRSRPDETAPALPLRPGSAMERTTRP
jgi:hypothetical protein